MLAHRIYFLPDWRGLTMRLRKRCLSDYSRASPRLSAIAATRTYESKTSFQDLAR
jgi:hypothetical protein